MYAENNINKKDLAKVILCRILSYIARMGEILGLLMDVNFGKCDFCKLPMLTLRYKVVYTKLIKVRCPQCGKWNFRDWETY